MLTKLLTVTAVSALMLSPALAQTTNSPAGSPTPAPATTTTPGSASPGVTGSGASGSSASTPSTSSSSTAMSGSGSAQFVAKQDTSHWLASKFMGTDVMGANNEKIGDVNDVMFDKDGKINAVLVGVGGFLGIGEKNVAIDLKSFQWDTGDAADMGDDKLKLSMTRDQLKEAPAFEAYRSPARTTGAAPGSNTGTAGSGTAPATSR